MSQQAQPSGTGFTGGLYIKLSDGTYVPVVDANGNLLAPVTTTDLTTTGNTTLGNGGADTTTVVSASATALTVGANGATNPVLQVDAATASVATGLKLTGAAAAGGFALAVISSGTDENLTINAKGTGTISLATVSTGRVNINSSLVITTTGANGLAVGPNGVTSPTFQVNASVGSAATGVRVVAAAANSGAALSAISSATDEDLFIDAKGADAIILGNTSTGMIVHRRKVTIAQGAPTAKTVSATLTAAEILAGLITVNQAGGATSAQQLPLASDMDTGFPNMANGDAFDFSVINTSTVAAEDASITTNTGWTLVGSMVVESNDNDRAASSGRFRARKTGTAAWTLYRIS